LYAEQTVRTNRAVTTVYLIVLSNLHVHIIPNIFQQLVQTELNDLHEISQYLIINNIQCTHKQDEIKDEISLPVLHLW